MLTEEPLLEVFEYDLERAGRRFTFNWTSDSEGDYETTFIARGCLVLVKLIPASGGDQPSDGYDVTLLDADGHDVLEGLGEDASNSEAVRLPESGTGVFIITYLNGTYTLKVENAGNEKQGIAILEVKNR